MSLLNVLQCKQGLCELQARWDSEWSEDALRALEDAALASTFGEQPASSEHVYAHLRILRGLRLAFGAARVQAVSSFEAAAVRLDDAAVLAETGAEAGATTEAGAAAGAKEACESSTCEHVRAALRWTKRAEAALALLRLLNTADSRGLREQLQAALDRSLIDADANAAAVLLCVDEDKLLTLPPQETVVATAAHADVVSVLLDDRHHRLTASAQMCGVLLECAVTQGHERTFAMLLDDARVNLEAFNAPAVLQSAATLARVSVVSALLAHPRVILSHNSIFSVAVHVALDIEFPCDNHCAILAALIRDQRVEDPLQHLANLLHRSMSINGSANIARVLLSDPRIDLHASFAEELLVMAVRNEAPVMFCTLLQHPRISVDAAALTRLFELAAKYRRTEIIDALLGDARLDFVDALPRALNAAAFMLGTSAESARWLQRIVQDPRTLALLTSTSSQGREVRDRSNLHGVLCHAMWFCDVGFVDVMLAEPCAVDPSAENDLSGLLAVQCASLEVILRMLADPRVLPSSSTTSVKERALMWSCNCGQFSVVERLLADDDVDPSVDGGCCLLFAVQRLEPDIAELLLACPRFRLTRACYDAAVHGARTTGFKRCIQLLESPRVVALLSQS